MVTQSIGVQMVTQSIGVQMVNPEYQGSDGNPEYRGSDGNPEYRGSDGNPEYQGSDGDPEYRGSDGNPEYQGSDGNPEYQGSDGNPEENVLSHLSDRVFDRPICEVLLNQKYFNGIGNYLRAEILFRLNIPPFVKARTVLEGLQTHLSEEDQKSVVKVETTDTEVSDRAAVKVVKVESETPDLLSLCHTVPLEVIKLGGKGYDPENKDYSAFKSWLQCYYVDGMRSIRDHNGRTVWFKGDPGPMAPKGEALAEPKTEENPSTMQQPLTLFSG
ncbi:unnamed protein product [Coregonus sp. 'balchen']|nr:unnamed protein product [Coregonus sp. 'balchen']